MDCPNCKNKNICIAATTKKVKGYCNEFSLSSNTKKVTYSLVPEKRHKEIKS